MKRIGTYLTLILLSLLAVPQAYAWRHVSPYAYCAGDPVNRIDVDGKETRLFATSLPGASDFLDPATHTFIIVSDEENNIRGYYAFGSEYEGAKGAFDGQLKGVRYRQDLEVYHDFLSGKVNDHYKGSFEIKPENGTTQDQLDNTVIRIAESFGNNSDIRYFLFPISKLQGNCNSSSYTILKKAGVSDDQLKRIECAIPGISSGFGVEKPWTIDEQEKAVENHRKTQELIHQNLLRGH